jgi:uncharacterized membrane protein YqiK
MVSAMEVDKINSNRDKFLAAVLGNVEVELKKLV